MRGSAHFGRVKMSFQNKVVIVTGSSSGIGAAAAIQFAKEGADVVLVARNETKLQNVAAQCKSVGKEPLIVRADVSNEEDARRIIESTLDKYGKLDVLVNNAGIVRHGDIMSGKAIQSYDEIMNINLRAVVSLTTLAAPQLAKTKGNIVNISSVAGLTVPTHSGLIYGVSKAALIHLTKGVALELSAVGVRVNCISPGPVYSDIFGNAELDISFDSFKSFTALGRVSEPEELADFILFVASDRAKGVTGSNFVHDNGMLLKC